MIHIQNPQDCQSLSNPELQREVISYLLYCRMEFLEEEADIDDHGFNSMVLDETQFGMR